MSPPSLLPGATGTASSSPAFPYLTDKLLSPERDLSAGMWKVWPLKGIRREEEEAPAVGWEAPQ